MCPSRKGALRSQPVLAADWPRTTSADAPVDATTGAEALAADGPVQADGPRSVHFHAVMIDQASSLNETLAPLQADRDARRFDGMQFEDAVLRHAADISSWEIAECWRYRKWPACTVGVPLPPLEAGIDLVAVKRDGSRLAIQCKARSGVGIGDDEAGAAACQRSAVVGVR